MDFSDAAYASGWISKLCGANGLALDLEAFKESLKQGATTVGITFM